MAGPSREGEIIDGKYRVLRLLGEGGMGAVYAGEHVRLKKAVAIKVLHAGANVHAEMADRFEREAQAAGQIGSDHIVEVFDIGATATGDRFMVMEYLEGEPLRTRLKRLRRLREVEAAEVASQMLEGLGAAHRAGIVHRDLKPDNVFICREKAGRRDFVKVLDFGISKFSQAGEAGSMTKTGTIMGSPNYMSPEHVQASHEVDARSDLYSVGIVLFEAVTGKIPRKAATFAEILFKVVYEPVPDPRTVEPDLDPEFAEIVLKACAHRKDLRYQSAEEFKSALDRFLAMRRSGMPAGAFADPVTPGTSDGFRTLALPPGALPPPAAPSHPGSSSQPNASSQPSFGGSQPSFGGSQPAFGGSQSAFGGSQPAFGSQPSFGGSQPAFGSQPSFSGSQPAFGGQSSPAVPSGHPGAPPHSSSGAFSAGTQGQPLSQPAFGNGSQPSYASQFSVTHQPYGEAPPPKRRLGVFVAIAAAALSGIAVAAVIATRAASPVATSPSKPTNVAADAPPSTASTQTNAPADPSPSAPAASVTAAAATDPTAVASAEASAEPKTAEPKTEGAKPQGDRPQGGKPTGSKPTGGKSTGEKPPTGPSAGY